jgi:3-deoxy-manno-octulosonate cytidylyltransferase (CMP-KDO synthetase)
MIQHVYERACRASLLSRVIVATDDSRIVEAVQAFGGDARMTSPDHPSGTDRVAEVAEGLRPASRFVNIQGDEPLIDPSHIDVCARMLLDGDAMSTLATRVRWRHELFDQNVVKLVIGESGHALYFSRSAIPFPRKYLEQGIDVDLECAKYYRHVGVYGYNLDTLRALVSHEACEMEKLESLEQLRALALGIGIRVGMVDSLSPCVDVPADIGKVEGVLSEGDQG